MKKNRTAAGILALLLGTIGVHKFYLGKWKQGLLCLLFFWTGIPGLVGLYEGVILLGTDEEETVAGEAS